MYYKRPLLQVNQIVPNVKKVEKRFNKQQSTIITLLYDVGNPERVRTILSQARQWLTLSFPVVIWTDDVYYDTLKTFFQSKIYLYVYRKIEYSLLLFRCM